MFYLAGGATVPVLNGGTVPLNIMVNQLPGSALSLPSTGNIQISDTGYYLISFGVSVRTNTTPGIFRLELTPPGGSAPVYQILDFRQVAGQNGMYSITSIVRITTNPTTIRLVNRSGASFNIGNASTLPTGGPAAYVTIIKIK